MICNNTMATNDATIAPRGYQLYSYVCIIYAFISLIYSLFLIFYFSNVKPVYSSYKQKNILLILKLKMLHFNINMQITFQTKKETVTKQSNRVWLAVLVPVTISSLSIFNSLLFKDLDHKMEISQRKSLRKMLKLEISSNKFLQQRKLIASKLRICFI